MKNVDKQKTTTVLFQFKKVSKQNIGLTQKCFKSR